MCKEITVPLRLDLLFVKLVVVSAWGFQKAALLSSVSTLTSAKLSTRWISPSCASNS